MTKGKRRRNAGLTLGLTGVLGSLLTVATTVPAQATAEVQRLAGQSRYETAVRISSHRFPGKAEVVYLARGDGFADALAAGALVGGPVLLVPSGGTIPAGVRTEVERLDPARVVALGGAAAVPQRTLDSLATGRQAGRLAGSSRFDTAVEIARAGFPSTASKVYLARADGFADALAAGALTGGPILLVPSDGTVPAGVASEVKRLSPDSVVALGGPAAVPQRTLAELAEGRSGQRLAGPSRYETATAITRDGFPSGATTVYLARGDGYADALAAGSLDAPILLVPSSGEAPSVVADEVRRLAPSTVIALGGQSAVPQRTLEAMAAAAGGQQSTPPTPPDPGGDPANPPPPSPGESGGTNDQGGPIGEPSGEPPPPPGDQNFPADPQPFVNVGERYDRAAPEPPDGETTGLPGDDGSSSNGVSDPMPTWPAPASAKQGRLQAHVQHQQPNFPITDWGALPYNDLPSYVGRIYVSQNGTNWRGQCTGTVIGANQIITAAHCFFDRSKSPQTYFRFYPDLHGSQALYGYWEGTINGAFVDRHYLDYEQGFWADYGILKLSPNAGGQRIGDTVGQVGVFTDGDQYTENRFTIGYPTEGMYDATQAALGSPHAQCRDESCRPFYCWSPVGGTYRWENTGYYTSVGFGCYGNGGWSGGPIFQYSNGKLYLVSVVSTGGNIQTYTCPAPVCRWYGRNSWGPTFRYDRLVGVWNAAQ